MSFMLVLCIKHIKICFVLMYGIRDISYLWALSTVIGIEEFRLDSSVLGGKSGLPLSMCSSSSLGAQESFQIRMEAPNESKWLGS